MIDSQLILAIDEARDAAFAATANAERIQNHALITSGWVISNEGGHILYKKGEAVTASGYDALLIQIRQQRKSK